MQKTIDREEITEEISWFWDCPNCGFENEDIEEPEYICHCISCGESFEVEY